MTRKEIKKFYLSLIDNPDAIWTKEEYTYSKDILLHCTCNDIRIIAYSDYQLVFQYIGKDSRLNNTSDSLTYQDIGISYFRLLFPFFGIVDRVKRRIKNDKRKKNSIESIIKLDSISTIIAKDKALLRDSKLNQLLK